MTEDQISIPTDRYVYYDDHGEITSISNTNDEEGNYITVPLEKVMNFLLGKESTSFYVVVYDTLIKQHMLKLKYHSDETAFRIGDEIFKVNHSSCEKPDLVITQDLLEKKWRFQVDEGLKLYLKSQSFDYNKKLYFSITRKNDPNELYRVLTVNFKDLVEKDFCEIDFEFQSEGSKDDLSVYTTKKFETYVHEVINDW